MGIATRWGFFSKNLGKASILKAKILGVMEGLKLFINKGYKKIVLESDSKLLVGVYCSNKFFG